MAHKLLLADDSMTIQRVIELTFADEDIQVAAVSDGDQAIARLEAQPPDIVLADVGMPGRSGYDVAAYIRNSPRLSHIPVVLLTGAFEPIDQARAAAVGCDGVLSKPFEPQLVISRVKELLARPARAPMASPANVAPPPTVPLAPLAIDARTPPVDPPPPAVAARPAQGAGGPGTDDYFDRLDAAFASLSSASAPAKAPAQRLSGESNPVADSIDWFSQRPAAAAPAAVPARSAPQRPTPPSSAPAPRAILPPLADAFAALLAAEQATTTPAAAAPWPVPSGAPPTLPAPAPQAPAPPVPITDELVDRVTQRVLEQLSDRVVRETVSEIAERLVREEIERIKSTMR